MIVVVSLLVLFWSYWRSSGPVHWRWICSLCRAAAIGLLGLLLLEPMRIIEVPRSGSNLVLVMADSSRSLQVTDADQAASREQQMRRVLVDDKQWQERIGDAFDLRTWTFDRELVSSPYGVYAADGSGTAISRSLNSLAGRFRNRPVAGIILLTDGNDTDPVDIRFDDLPPVYPVVVGGRRLSSDASIGDVSVSQTNFEAAPVTISATVRTTGMNNQPLTVQLINAGGEVVADQQVTSTAAEQQHPVRFQFSPRQPGVSQFRLRVTDQPQAPVDEAPRAPDEATAVNNQLEVVVDRARGPYRVLYVSGRPNWEFKFLRRALQQDDEVDLVGLIRIAREEPKFTFRSRGSERTNPLFRGFGNDRDEEAQQYDEPVLVRMGTRDATELRDGFPKSAEELFQYQAIVLDDVESAFFSSDQLSLIEQFVSRRGGGFLMLGGQESFAQGDFDRTPVGELLPVYLDSGIQFDNDTGYRLSLTREGWLQPWVRVESTETVEQQRLDTMPGFATVNQVRNVKPGAMVLAEVTSANGDQWPALVAQRFGRGRSAAMMIGDLWRWHLQGETGEDLLKSWRQTVRWLVADVPRRVDVRVEEPDHNTPGKTVFVDVVDQSYQPLDNARVTAVVTRPDGEQVTIPVRPADDRPGTWQLDYLARQSGVYRVEVEATRPDGQLIGKREGGWVSDQDTAEFARLQPNREYLQRIADRTGGALYDLDDIDRLSRQLPVGDAPWMEKKSLPWWHSVWAYALVLGLLVSEWGIRRWQGMA